MGILISFIAIKIELRIYGNKLVREANERIKKNTAIIEEYYRKTAGEGEYNLKARK